MNVDINLWAAKHGISLLALTELRDILTAVNTDPPLVPGESEKSIQNRVRLEASRKGLRLWRNNVGATMDSRGNFIRYGLCNDSKQMNQIIKSSDLIGIRPVIITQEMVDKVIGQFVAREIKAAKWKYTGNKREQAQLKFLELIIGMGGDAMFANGEGSI